MWAANELRAGKIRGELRLSELGGERLAAHPMSCDYLDRKLSRNWNYRSCYYIKKINPILLYHKSAAKSIGFYRPALKKRDHCLSTHPCSIVPRRNICSSMWAVNYLDKSTSWIWNYWRSCTVSPPIKKLFSEQLLYLYLYFPSYYTTNYSVCQYGCELRRGIFLIKTLKLLLKSHFIIP